MKKTTASLKVSKIAERSRKVKKDIKKRIRSGSAKVSKKKGFPKKG